MKPPRWDWEKYPDTYRVWGQKLYNPDARRCKVDPALARPPAASCRSSPPRTCRRRRTTTTGRRSTPITRWWSPARIQYSDTPAPKVFGNVTPLDPQLFSRMSDFADELLKGERGGKYSPVEVAQWLEDLAGDGTPAARDVDVADPGGSRALLRAPSSAPACCIHLHEQTGDRAALEEALKCVSRGARRLGATRRTGQGRLRRRTSRWASSPGCAATGSTACPRSTKTSPRSKSAWPPRRRAIIHGCAPRSPRRSAVRSACTMRGAPYAAGALHAEAGRSR